MQKQVPEARRNSNIILWHPSGVRPPVPIRNREPGGPAGAGPPATFYQPSGLEIGICFCTGAKGMEVSPVPAWLLPHHCAGQNWSTSLAVMMCL